MIDLKQAFDSPVVVTGSKLAAKAAGALAVAVLARALGQAAYGEFVFLTSLTAMVIAATVGPADTLVARYGSDPTRSDVQVRRILARLVAASSIAGLLLFGLAVSGVENPIREWEPWVIAAGAASMPFRGASKVLEAYHTARKRFDVAQIGRLAEVAAWLAVLTLAWTTGWLDLRLVVALFLGRQAVAVLFLGAPYLWLGGEEEKASGSSEGGESVGQGKEGRSLWSQFRADYGHLYPNALFAVMVASADAVMLGYLSTEAQTGLYGIAATVFGAMMLLPNGINYYLRSRTGDRSFYVEGNYHRYCRLGFASVALLGAGAFAAAPWIVRILAGPDFGGAVLPLRVLSVALVARSSAALFSSLWVHLERYRLVSVLTAANGILNVALNFWAVPRFGAAGAAVTSLASYSVGFVLNVVLVSRLENRPQPLQAYFLPAVSDLRLLRRHLRSLV